MGLRQLAYNTTATILSRIIPARALIVANDTFRLFLGTGTSTPREIAFKSDIPGLPVGFAINDVTGVQTMTGNFGYTAQAFTAARTVALPVAASFVRGAEVIIADLLRTVSATNKLTVSCSSSDTINGVSSLDLADAGTIVRFVSDGVANWSVDDRVSTSIRGPASSSADHVPQWSDVSGRLLKAGLTIGGANGLLQLDGSGAIPSNLLSGVMIDTSNLVRFNSAQLLNQTQLSQLLANVGDAFAAPGAPGVNYSLSPAVASNALTMSVLTHAGNTPTAADPIKLSFRNPSWSSGQWSSRTATSGLSLTIPSGATLGHASNVIGSLYWYAIDNAGSVELAVAGSFIGNDGIVSTLAISSSSSSATVMYSAVARSGIPFVLLGRTADTQTTAGTWSVAPSHIQAVRSLSTIEQTVYSESTANALLSAGISFSDAVPQATSGTQILSATIAPRWPTNRMRILSRGYGGQNGSFGLVAAIFSSLSANALDANWFVTNGAGYRSSFSCQAEHAPGSLSAIVYSLRVGPAAGGSGAVLNGTYNGTTISRDFGGAARTTLIVEEITA